MNLDIIKNNIKKHLGSNILIKCNLGRNKYEHYNVKIIKVYNNVFLVEGKNKDIKSFSYNDIIMKTIKIDFL
jgi:uncharacterized protein Veg